MNEHAETLLSQYRGLLPVYRTMADKISSRLKSVFDEAGIIVAAIEHRVKTEGSLAGKLELKGNKYHSIRDITDIVGVRVITFYNDDVGKVASALERLYDIDWENSIDKRKAHEIDSFGYLSLHYICSFRKEDCADCPDMAGIRFEVQMRTVLQHAWANMNHDTGYKSGVEIPKVYLRNLSRLAGMLELVDDEFSRIRSEFSDYRRRVQSLVASGNLEEVALDGDSFRSYLALNPFEPLVKRISALNQAEVQHESLLPYLAILKAVGCKTLGDVDRMVKEYSDAAYQIACFQMGLTDLDIISSTVGIQDICIAYILKNGGGKAGLRMMFDLLNGPSESNDSMAAFLVEETADLPFLNQ